jgi:pimeloyl-ACP methyl ester carboxylesterase
MSREIPASPTSTPKSMAVPIVCELQRKRRSAHRPGRLPAWEAARESNWDGGPGPRLARYLHGMALSNSHAARPRIPSPRPRYDGLRTDGISTRLSKDLILTPAKDAPQVPPNQLSEYSLKRASTDLKALANKHGAERIVLGGHDWGGAIVYRVCLWYPEFVTHLFSVCTPYATPSKDPYVDLETRTNTVLPNFKYQVQLASGEVEKHVKDRDTIHNFLSGMYGGRGPNGEVVFTTEKGVLFENLGKIGPSPLMSSDVRSISKNLEVG